VLAGDGVGLPGIVWGGLAIDGLGYTGMGCTIAGDEVG